MMTEVNISNDTRKLVRNLLNQFLQEAREVTNVIGPKLMSNDEEEGIYLTEQHANVLKAILKSQKDNIESRIRATADIGAEAPVLVSYFRDLIQQLDNVTFTDNVF